VNKTSSPQDKSTAMSEKPISPLRQRMIENMNLPNFGEKTRNDYTATSNFHSLPRSLARYSNA
jgi:hypothetical protein